jgi:hypothetical protein
MATHPGLVAFSPPPSLSVEVTLPHRGVVRGMGIRQGITLIAGGGFHGKSTLLQALEAGVYNKVGTGQYNTWGEGGRGGSRTRCAVVGASKSSTAQLFDQEGLTLSSRVSNYLSAHVCWCSCRIVRACVVMFYAVLLFSGAW